MIFDEIAHFLHDCRSPVDLGHWAHRLRVDPTFAAEMRVCREWRIPHSHFLGGPCEWTTHDREKAVAYVVHESGRCKECGTHPDDWPEETDTPPLEPFATRCYGCVTLNQYIQTYKDGNKDRHGEVPPEATWGFRPHLRPVNRDT